MADGFNEDGIELVPDEFREFVNGCSVPGASKWPLWRRITDGWWGDACAMHDVRYHVHDRWWQKFVDDAKLAYDIARSVPGNERPPWWKRVLWAPVGAGVGVMYWAGTTVGGWRYFRKHRVEEHLPADKARIVRIKVG